MAEKTKKTQEAQELGNEESKNEAVETEQKKENIFKRGLNWAKEHKKVVIAAIGVGIVAAKALSKDHEPDVYSDDMLADFTSDSAEEEDSASYPSED